MHDANDDEEDDDDNDDHFYSGGDDDAVAGLDSDDADMADYEFIDNDSDDSDDVVSHRFQVGALSLSLLDSSRKTRVCFLLLISVEMLI